MKQIKGFVFAAVIAALAGTGFAQSEEVMEDLSTAVQQGIETFEWGLLLEAEGAYAKTGDEQQSDLILATVEFTADAAVTEWLSGHVGLLWEEDATDPMALDEGFITIGTGFYAQAGKYYLPFGNFETAFISDPLTLELAEINKSSVLVGYATSVFDVSAGAFKGDNEDVIQNVYAAANVNIGESAVAGIYFLSDLLETDGNADLNTLAGTDRQAGAGAYANVYLGPVTLNGEFVTALSEYTFFGQDYLPMAYNIEASVGFAEKWVAGLKFEGSDDFWTTFDDPDAPTALAGLFHESAVGGVISYGFHDNAVIGVEYMRLMNKGADDADLVTVQLALEI